MKAISFFIALTAVISCRAASPTLRFAWKEVEYVWDSSEQRESAINNGNFIKANNLPLGLARWKNKLFVTLPRWKKGVASSLNYIDIDGAQDQPLKPYPSFKDNLFADTAKELPSNSSIVSVFRMFIDPCDRLWVMDSGRADILGTKIKVAPPSIVIFDLNTDTLIERYFFKEKDLSPYNFFANIAVEVDKDTCDNAFAYASDIGAFSLMVYSFKQNDAWRVDHHYFHIDPLGGTFNVGGIETHWADGVFGLALSEPREDGFRTLYFHAFSSTKEFSVSTEVLQNYKNFDKNKAFHEFKLLGDRGELSQSSASYYDANTNVMFFTQVNKDGVGCWNTNNPHTPEYTPLIISGADFEFVNDVKVDNEGSLWILSDRLTRFMYSSLDPNDINYRIFSINAADAIVGTACQ